MAEYDSEEIAENALFHYTNATGLMGILKDNSLRATAYYCTNDRAEFTYSKDVIESLFSKELLSKFPYAYQPTSMLAEEMALKYAKEMKRFLDECDTYITCFTMAKNKTYKHGLLSQWRGYGKDGGYAIEFNFKMLEKIYRVLYAKYTTSSGKKISGTVSPLEKVNYGKSEQNKLANDIREKYIKPWVNQFGDLKDIISDPRKIDFIDEGEKLARLWKMAAFTKNPHFDEEHEYRVFILEKNKKCKYFNRNGLIVPYVIPKMKIIPCIQRIIIGPSPRIDDRERTIKSLLKSYNMDDVIVEQSEIPYDKG